MNAVVSSSTGDIDFRPEDPAILANPYPLFTRMRDEDPCHWSPRLKSWVLTRYDDIKRACQSDQLSSDRLRPFFASMPSAEAKKIGDIIRYLSLWMVFKDAPEHTRLRRLTSRVFHAKSMKGMQPQVEEMTEWLLTGIDQKLRDGAIVGQSGPGEFDFITEFAGPLPCLVIMAMLGVPRTDLALLKRLSDDMALFIGSSRVTAEKYDTAQSATQEMAAYFRRLIGLRRQVSEADLLSELVHLRDGSDPATADRLSEDELVATCILLLFAGHETTTNHIANGMLSLMQFPDEQAKLRADPTLANAAIEELLRFEGPSGAQVRVVSEPQTIHGKSLAVGDRVFMMLNAANRDPRAYANPDALDLNRDGVMHLTFGFGQHICLGFPLARLEGQIAIPAVLRRWPSIELASDNIQWLNSMVFRGMSALPVKVG
jgi:cytochrome P450